MAQIEEWKDIKDFPGYQISNQGHVRSFKLHNAGQVHGFDKVCEEAHLMKTDSDDGNGYLKVMLRKEGKSYYRKIHRLVAEAFIENPKPDEYDTVDHISNDKKDNSVNNLRWISRRENVIKAYKDGLHIGRLARQQIPILLQDPFTGEELSFRSIGEAAEFLGVDYTTICHVFQGGSESGRIRDYFIWKN